MSRHWDSGSDATGKSEPHKGLERWNKTFKIFHLVNWVSKQPRIRSPRMRILSKVWKP